MTPARLLLSAATAGALIAACEKRETAQPSPPAPPPRSANTTPAPAPELASADLVVPEGAGAQAPVPFILFLHGLGHSGPALAEQLDLAGLSRKRRFAYAAPSGSPDDSRRRFWNAWDACCDIDRHRPDHLRALRQLLERAAQNPALDPRRRYVFGFSNGGFMAHRLACEVPGIAAIASIAGAGPAPDESCRPPGPVAVLQVHGDADTVIAFDGGHTLGDPALPVHPSAPETIGAWAKRNGCGALSGEPPAIDLEPELLERETRVLRYPGCRSATELWRVRGGGHVVALRPPAVEQVIGFLERQRAP